MAIAKMKQITLLAEQANKEQLLRAVQELQKLELFDLSALEENELLDYYSATAQPESRAEHEEKMKLIQSTLAYLNQYVKQPNALKKMMKGRNHYTLKELEQKVSAFSLDQVIDEVRQIERKVIDIHQQRKTLTDTETFLRKWEGLDFNPNDLETFKVTTGKIGTISSASADNFQAALKESSDVYVEEVFRYKDEAAYLVISPANSFGEVNEVLNQFQFTNLNYPYQQLPKKELKSVLNSLSQLSDEEKSLKATLQNYDVHMENLKLSEEYYANLVQRDNAKSLLLNGSSLFILNGWLEEEEVNDLTVLLDTHVGQENYAIMTDEIHRKHFDFVPTVLKNNALVEPFESVTEMYSLPKYNDIDPTPFMMPFYLVFFGMMSADLGYGLVLMLGTFAAMKFFNMDKGMARFIKFFHLLSYSVIVWGLIYGSFFGATLPIQLLSTTDDVITILLLSVVFGFIQMVYGLIINGVVKWKQQQRSSSYVDGLAWAGVLIGLALLIVDMMIMPNAIIRTLSYILIFANVIGIILVSTMASKNKGLGFALGLYNLYGVTGYVGDLVSYTRLMALGVSGGSIAVAFNMIVQYLPTAARFSVGIILIIALHALNIFLTYLSAYVHTARLQYVEFFGKFYEGGGRPLSPLKTLEKHIYLKKDTK